MESQDKFIGFVDILGYKNLVERAEKGEGMSLKEIDEAGSDLGSEADRQAIKEYGPAICPMANKKRWNPRNCPCIDRGLSAFFW